MLEVFKDKEILSDEAARFFVTKAAEAIEARGKFTVALTGGSSPSIMHKLLKTTYKDQIDWSKVFVFWCDERWVPIADERSNAGTAFDEFLNDLDIPASQIFPMYKDGFTAVDYAAEYESIMGTVLEEGAIFDLIFLGMGDDGHTASLFPGQAVIHETEKKVDAFFLEAQDMYRITLTAPVLNKAREVAFLVFGEKKAPALFEVLKGEANVDLYPSQIIKKEAVWFVDEAAASKL